jgi:acyl-CoA thioester hydrolase
MGHVNNSVYFTFFEQGRVEFFQNVFRSDHLKEFDIVVAHVRCDFLLPIKLMDEISLHLWVSNIGRKSFAFRYNVVSRADSSLIYAKGVSIQVFYEKKKKCSVIIPDNYRIVLQEYLTDK